MTTLDKKLFGDLAGSIDKILGRSDWEIYKDHSKLGDKFGGHNYRLVISDKEGYTENVAEWGLIQMIGCCGICVSTRSFVSYKYRNKGLGSILNEIRIIYAKCLGYGILMCTDIEQNTAQRKILAKNGWKDIFSFVNPRSSNTVFISVIELTTNSKYVEL